MIDRELLINLVFSGGSPDLAHINNNTYTIKEYEDALTTTDYKSLAETVEKDFIANADLRLLGRLYQTEQALKEMGVKDKNYPSTLKAYTELLKLTSPIIERLQKVKIEANSFEGLELVIKNVNTDV